MTRRPAHDRTTSPSLTPQALALSALLAWGLLPEGQAPGTLARWREPLRNGLPNRADYDRMELGYYENLLEDRPETPRARGGPQAAAGPAAVNGRLTLKVDDVREFVLKPNLVRDPGHGVPWSTNSLGMRDLEYARRKPPATFRVALVGDSIGAGWGVDDGEGFEPQLERRWNDRSRGAGGPAVEFLNFAVPGHGPGQRWAQFATIGWDFGPDLVVYEATPADAGWDERRLRSALARGIGFDAPVYHDVLAAAGVKPGGDAESYRRSLKPLRWNLLEGVYRHAAEECRRRGVRSAWVLIPRVGRPIDPDVKAGLLRAARGSGFDAVVDASDIYDGADPAALAVSPSDYHPNAEGHARITRALDDALVKLPDLSNLWDRGPRPPGRDGAGPPPGGEPR